MAAPSAQAMQAQQQQQAIQAFIAQQQQQALRKQDLDFMRSLEQIAACPVTGGSGTTAAYAVGSTFYFDLPVMPSGFAKGILIKYNLAVTPATASGATYNPTQAGAFAAVGSELQIQYNGTQARTHPYIAKIIDQTRGFLRGAQNKVLAGNSDSSIASTIVGSTPTVPNVANTWQGQIYLPFNALSEDDVKGILPVSGAGTHAQVKITTPANFMGNDPLINPVYATGGTAPSVAVTGTLSVDMVFLNGANMDVPHLLPPPPSVYGPTLQYFWEPSGTPLNTNAMSRFIVQNKMKHHYMVSLVIDGGQSNQFATWANLTQFELTGDPTGSQKLKSWNVSNNVPISDYWDRDVRRKIGQDLDPGVILWVCSPIRGTVNASNRMGQAWLNMYPGGFPTATHGYVVTSPGSPTGYSPRIETLLISENTKGLGLQQVG